MHLLTEPQSRYWPVDCRLSSGRSSIPGTPRAPLYQHCHTVHKGFVNAPEYLEEHHECKDVTGKPPALWVGSISAAFLFSVMNEIEFLHKAPKIIWGIGYDVRWTRPLFFKKKEETKKSVKLVWFLLTELSCSYLKYGDNHPGKNHWNHFIVWIL